MFENWEVSPEQLPSADNVEWRGLHANFVQRLRAQAAIIAGVAGIGLAGAHLFVDFPILQTLKFFVILVLSGFVLLGWPSLSVPRRGFVVRDRDILFRRGVVWRSVTAVPFNRIQHVETSSTPLDRQFGLATLQLFTAGGSGGDLRIEGLGRELAEQLRKLIVDKTGASIENA